MKKILTTSLFVFMSMLISISVYAKDKKIVTKGHWAGGIVRSLLTPPPEVYISGNTLFITCEEALTNLTVMVYNANGDRVARRVISIQLPGEVEEFDILNIPGSYEIVLTHSLGRLSGYFELE